MFFDWYYSEFFFEYQHLDCILGLIAALNNGFFHDWFILKKKKLGFRYLNKSAK